MAKKRQLEFFLLRYVPNAVRGEFVNIGVVILERDPNRAGFAAVRFTRDWRRVRCLDPGADIEMLKALEREIREQFRDNAKRKLLLQKMEESFSNVVQLSSRKPCTTEDPAKEIELLAALYLEDVRPGRTAR